MAIAAVFFVAIVAAYAGLISAGHWQDEYSSFTSFREHGWEGLYLRIVNWSPRPFSELLLFVYSRISDSLEAPLITEALAFLWMFLATSIFVVPLVLRRVFSDNASLWQTLVLGAALFCLLLVGHPVAEYFYWPQSSVAYIPATAGVLMAMWLLLLSDPRSARARWAFAGSLVIAALSAEVGAMLVFVFCSLAVGLAILQKVRFGASKLAGGHLVLLCAPFVAAVFVLIMIRLARLENQNEIFGDPGVAHRMLPSLKNALSTFVRESLSVDGMGASVSSLFMGFATKALFALASYATFRTIRRRQVSAEVYQQWIGLLGLACISTVFLTLAAAYYQFGLVCCQRHGTFRQGLVFIGLMSIAGYVALRRSSDLLSRYQQPAQAGAVVALILAVAIPLSISARDVLEDYRGFAKRLKIAALNWKSGIADTQTASYITLPQGRIVGGLIISEGTFDKNSKAPGSVTSIIDFYRKSSMTFIADKDLAVQVVNPPAEILTPITTPSPRCNIDIVNGRPYSERSSAAKNNQTISLQGWTAPDERVRSGSIRTWIVASTPDGLKRYYMTVLQKRQDVADAFDQAELLESGFTVTIDLATGSDNEVLTLLSVNGKTAYECEVRLEIARNNTSSR